MNLERRISNLETALASSGLVTVLLYAGETVDEARERHVADGGADPITAALAVWIEKPVPRLH